MGGREVPGARTLGGRATLAPVGVVDRLTRLCLAGLATMDTGGERGVVQTVRGVASENGPALRPEGRNLRYAAIASLGLARLDAADQRRGLHGVSAMELARESARQARRSVDAGAVALAAWALAEVVGEADPVLLGRLEDRLSSGRPLATVEVAWMVTAGTAANAVAVTAGAAIAATAAQLLMDAQGPTGIFPHALAAGSIGRLRARIGCFADQVYPIQALARHAAAVEDHAAMAAANRCAAAICSVQGPAGQWWWHYDARDGSVVERYPVYSVHQHAMAPMALFDLADCGGDDHTAEVLAGLDWLRTHPETFVELVDDAHGVVWRKVGRREPPKAARRIAAVTTAVRRGWHLPGVDRVLPATEVDFECRPYELGWLLYAWHGGPDGEPLGRLHGEGQEVALLPTEAAPTPRPAPLFGMPVDAVTLGQAVATCDHAIRESRPVQIGVLNAAKMVRLRSDPLLRDSLLSCELLVADGQAVVWASRVLGARLPERVAGIDLFEALLALADRDQRKVYLLGARPEVVAQVGRVVRDRFPGAVVVGARDGYFTDDEAPAVAEAIRQSGADMLFLGMVSPKKEIFVGTYGQALGVPVVHGVGGSFDVLAGVTARAPLAWQRAGMEWAYRLKQEPRRLAGRYVRTNTAFVALTVRERFRPTTPYAAAMPPVPALRRVS